VKVTQERLEGSRIAITVEVDPEQVGKATDRAYQKLGSQVAVPGFRRGKAPRHILKSYLGDQRIRQEMLDDLLPVAYRDALKDSGVQPIADPELELVNVDPEQPVTFKATVPIAPSIQLGEYRSVRVAPQSTAVSDEQVDVALENLRKQHSTWEAVSERPVELGDEVVADIHGDVEGHPIIDLHRQVVVVGENGLPKDVDEGLVGLSAGEERSVVGTVANNHPDQALAGKEATYTIAVQSIRQRILPPVDDELAKHLPDVTSVEELRPALRRQLEADAAEAERFRRESAVIDAVIAGATLDYPHVLVDRQLDRMMETFATNVARQGFDPARYIQMLGRTPQLLRESWHGEAEQLVQRELVLDEVARAEGLEPAEPEIREELKRILEVGDDQLTNLLEQRPQLSEVVRASLRQRLALERLLHLAVDGTGDSALAPGTEAAEAAEPPTGESAVDSTSEGSVVATEHALTNAQGPSSTPDEPGD
jgi:trigger factor